MYHNNSIFVYHAEDKESTAMVHLLTLFSKDIQLEYLAVKTDNTLQRMHQFLENNDSSNARMPFIIIKGNDNSTKNVLHGKEFENWFAHIVNSMVQSTHPSVLRNALAPHLNTTLVQLILYCFSQTISNNNQQSAGPTLDKDSSDALDDASEAVSITSDDDPPSKTKDIILETKPVVPKVAMRSVLRTPSKAPARLHEPIDVHSPEMMVTSQIPERPRVGPVNISQSIAEGKSREQPSKTRH